MVPYTCTSDRKGAWTVLRSISMQPAITTHGKWSSFIPALGKITVSVQYSNITQFTANGLENQLFLFLEGVSAIISRIAESLNRHRIHSPVISIDVKKRFLFLNKKHVFDNDDEKENVNKVLYNCPILHRRKHTSKNVISKFDYKHMPFTRSLSCVVQVTKYHDLINLTDIIHHGITIITSITAVA